MTKAQIISGLLTPGVVAIIRADDSEQLIKASRALIEGGVSGIEITMTTPNALQVISDVCREFGDKVLAGVGSVLDAKTAEAALAAGAQYVVTPVLKPDVIAYCNRVDKPIFSGSYTPTEAQTAYELGADFIKIFPADGLGPKYIQAIRGPLPAFEHRSHRRSRCEHGGRFHPRGMRRRSRGQQFGQQGNPKEPGLGQADFARGAVHRRGRQGPRKIALVALVAISGKLAT